MEQNTEYNTESNLESNIAQNKKQDTEQKMGQNIKRTHSTVGYMEFGVENRMEHRI